MSNDCPCCSQKPFSDCCEPYLSGAAHAPTPEALMRSRYSAYALRNFSYIENTMKGKPLIHFRREATEKSRPDLIWDKLEVLSTPPASDTEGFVEFKAYYHDATTPQAHIYEYSRFIKQKGQWYYVEGLEKPSIGRNDPCPCGSQKKYKKCCALL